MRVIQPGSGDERSVVILYLVGPHLDAQIRSTLGPEPCVVGYAEGKPAETLDALVAKLKTDLGFTAASRIVLVGYSLGCSGVRMRLLEDGAARSLVDGLVLIDGTHAGLPPQPWQIDVWKKAFDRARTGEILAVATHTQQTYVEHLAPPQGPFLSTVSVLRASTGWPLLGAGPIDAPAVEHEGKLWIYSYASKSIDAPAHIQQQRAALPAALAKHVRPWLVPGDEIAGAPRDAGGPAEEHVLFGAEALEMAEHASAQEQRGAATPTPTRSGPPRAAQGAPHHHTLSAGSTGDDVRLWQQIIGAGADGIFGPKTVAATKAWQAAHGLEADGVVGPATWAAADIPATSLEVPRRKTPLTEAELAAALEHGHHLVFEEAPSRERLGCAWAQVALENGRGSAIYCNNFGNVSGFGAWAGRFYVFVVAERVSKNPDVWKTLRMKFRAYDDPVQGAADYWRILRGRYASALALFDAGSPDAGARELARLGYFTAHVEPYAKAMASLYRDFARLP